MSAQCQLNVCPMSAQCLPNVCPMSAQCPQFPLNVPYVCLMFLISAQCPICLPNVPNFCPMTFAVKSRISSDVFSLKIIAYFSVIFCHKFGDFFSLKIIAYYSAIFVTTPFLEEICYTSKKLP